MSLPIFPGLIEGAHKGAGLGIRFLRHIERTHILVHLIDASAIDPQNPLAGYATINQELVQYNPLLTQKQQIIVLNKMDLPGADQAAEAFQAAMDDDRQIFRISAAARKGIDPLKLKLV